MKKGLWYGEKDYGSRNVQNFESVSTQDFTVVIQCWTVSKNSQTCFNSQWTEYRDVHLLQFIHIITVSYLPGTCNKWVYVWVSVKVRIY